MDRAVVLSQETLEHQYRVAALTMGFAKFIGETEPLITTLNISSLYHDIGKIVVDQSILKKPVKLTKEEYEAVKNHAPAGAIILKEMDVNKDIIEAVMYHHESYNGTGYPEGKKGKEIPLAARILKICDVYDALTSKRVYRPRAYTDEEALLVMEKMKDEFDPELFKEFINYVNNKDKQTA